MKTMPLQQHSTKNYALFRLNAINRLEMKEKNVKPRKDLIESMKRDGFWKEEPIKGYLNEDGTINVLDGHNRLAAAQALGLPVEYIAYRKNGRGEMSPIKYSTVARKSWSVEDVVAGWAKQGLADYIELVEFHERTGISVNQAGSMFWGDLASSGNALKAIKSGAFKMREREYPEVVADLTETIGRFRDWATIAPLVAALSRSVLTPGFSPKRLKSKITKHHVLLEKQRNVDAYMALLETIYNWHTSDRFYLVAEADKAARSRSAFLAKK